MWRHSKKHTALLTFNTRLETIMKIKKILGLTALCFGSLVMTSNSFAQTQINRDSWSVSSNRSASDTIFAIDGNADTRWSSSERQRDGQTFEVDFNRTHTINQIVLDTSGSASDYPRGYELEVSTDGVNFTTIAEGEPSASGITTINFADQSVGIIRITQTGSDNRFWWSIHELNVFESNGQTGSTDFSDSDEWSLSASESRDLRLALDGNASTRWATRQTQRDGQFYQIDFNSLKTFDRVLLDTTVNEFDYPREYEVQVSDNGIDFTTVASGTPGNSPQTLITFAQQTAQYLRIEQNGSDNRRWWSIHEMTIASGDIDVSLFPESFTHSVAFNGETVDVNFNKFSSRGPLFSVFEQQANGNITEVESVNEISTYIGLVEGHPEAYAAGMINSDGSILATVIFPDEKTWRDQDGVVTEQSSQSIPFLPTGELFEEFLREAQGSDLYAIDLFLDVDNSFFVEAGASVVQALETLEYNFAVMNATFMRDAAILNRMGKIVIRADEFQDPYDLDLSLAEPGRARNFVFNFFLGESLSETEVRSGPHNVGALITARVAGLANGGGTVRFGTGFTIISTRANGNGYITPSGRHELGHIWGALHDEGGAHLEGATIMGSIPGSNLLSKFAAPSILSMQIARDIGITNGHLPNLGNVAPQLPPRAMDDYLILDIFDGNVETSTVILRNDNDVNGDAISIISVPEFSNAGNPVTFDGDSITVTGNVITPDLYDWVPYTIEDSSGLTSTAILHLDLN